MKRLIYTFALLFVTLSMMAVKIPSGTQLYLKPNSNWKSDNAWFAAYFFGNGEAWVKMLDNDGDGIYSCKAPNSGKNYTNVIFVRMDPNNSTLGWGAKWNQTGDLTWDGTKSLFSISNWGGGTWSVASIKYLTEGTTLYLKPTNLWTADNARFAVNFYSDFGETWVSMVEKVNFETYKVTIPSGNWTKFIFVRMPGNNQTNSWDNKWNQTENLSFDGTKNLYTISSSDGAGSWGVYDEITEGEKVSYYVAGTMNDWATNEDQMSFVSTELGASYVYENLKKGTHQFKVTDGTWDWTKGHSDFDKDNSQVTSSSNNDNNVKFELENDVAFLDIYLSFDFKISVKLRYNLNVSAQENGTVTGAGTYNHGVQVTITATPNDGYHFVQWSDGDKNASRTITVTKNTTLTAEFAVNTYTITLKAENGTVTGAGTYDHGSKATISATPNDGYHFVQWSDEDKNASRTITVTENTTYEAIFDKLCEFDELTEGTVYYIAAETINVANKYDKASIDMEKTSVDGLYQVTIPKGYFDRFVIGDKTFNSEQISTNRYYNGSEWLPYEASLDIPSQTPDRGLYGPISYQKTISGEDVNKWHWISLPFNAKISEIKGGDFDTEDFMIQEYDTEARSKWTSNIASENESAWRSMEKDETLMAGRGYILAVNDKKSSYSLTFVSESDLNIVKNQFDGNNEDYSSGVPESANWHLIGTGLYGEVNSFGGVDYVAIPQGNDYEYYNLSEEGLADLNAYGAFFVQHLGNYSFSKEAQIRNSAPRRIMEEDIVEHYYVSIGSGENAVNTAIFMAEDGTDNYVVGQDFLHLGASGESLQFYSKQGKNDLAFNYLKKEERTIALGGYVAEAGKYTISLTADGKASSVILYDSQTGEATDLLQYDYEFDAEKGYLDGRFDITIAYAAQDDTPTDVEIGGNDRLVVLNSDGIVTFEGLAIGEEVVVYDIMGRCVNHFVASNDVANVMLADGVYVMKHSSEIIKFVVNR